MSASAGSGKTYRLTREFVKLCLQYDDPSSATSTVAMTFTNKATAEMKAKILELLASLSKGEEAIGPNDVLFDIADKLGPEKLSERSERVLRHLLKHYHFFNVSTIDSFFQKLIRQFQRELSLNQSMRVELDQSMVIQESIKLLLDNLKVHSDAFKWLSGWLMDNLEDNKSWDFRSELESLGQELFKEGVTDDWEQLSTVDLESAFKGMRGYINVFDETCRSVQSDVRAILSEANLSPTDFSGGKNSFMSSWLKEGRSMFDMPPSFNEKVVNPEEWFSKAKRSTFLPIVEPYISDILDQYAIIEHAIEEDQGRYLSYKAVLSHFRTYVALRFIYDALQDWCRQNDVILISEANKLVAHIVLNNDSTILYEKSGQRYKQIMVDEFQDTSGLQWTNISPLIRESLATDNASLIVGDVKQSIYRWRNGDWQIMYSGVEQDLSSFKTKIIKESLDNNWRSDPSIVDFNNKFFNTSTDFLVDQVNIDDLTDLAEHGLFQSIHTIYSDVVQNAKRKTMPQGGVEVTILDPDGQDGRDYAEFIQTHDDPSNAPAKYWLKTSLDELFQSGKSPGDITILVRTTKESNLIVGWFQEWAKADGSDRYKVISESGYKLASDKVVQLLIHCLYFRVNPSLKANKLQIYALWSEVVRENGEFQFSNCESDPLFEEALSFILTQAYSTLTDFFVDIVKQWNLSEVSPAHLSSFLDVVRKYESEYGNDPFDFMAYWDRSGTVHSIASDHSADAVQIMTIHKSKGLQFNTVLLPFTDAAIGSSPSNKSIIYVEAPHDAFMSNLGKVPVGHSKSGLKDTFFQPFFVEETILRLIDDLNLLYVAFTRSVERLHIAAHLSKLKTDKTRSKSAGGFIRDSIERFYEGEAEDFVYRFGHRLTPEAAQVKKNKTELKEIDKLTFRANRMSTGSWLPRELTSIVSDGADQPLTPQIEGVILHDIMADLRSIDQLDSVMNRMKLEAKIPEMHYENIYDKASRFLQNPEIKSWFDPSLAVQSEKEILEVDGKAYRPDRVILKKDKTILIDFKTGEKRTSHHAQIKKYASLLERMNLPGIECYLAYFSPVSIVQVDPVR